jgi:hypothetical protein
MPDPVASRIRSRIAYWLFGLFLFAVAAATGFWFVGAELVRDRIVAAAWTVTGEAGTFSVAAFRVTGFPFHYDAHLTDVVLSGRDARGGWEWRAERAMVRLSPWLAREAAFDLAGDHKLRFHAGRLPLDLEITADEAPGTYREGGADAPHVVRITPRGVSAREVTTGTRVTAERAAVQAFLYAGREPAGTEPSAGLIVDVAGVGLPEAAGRFLGPRIESLKSEIRVLAGLPFPVERPALARWRADGGSIEVKDFALDWGPAKIESSGTATLDSDLQPEASFSAQMTGFEETLDALVAAGLVQAREVQGVKLVLSLMARRSEPGQGARIQVPLSIQDRTVYVGPARLTRLPQVRW